MMSSFPKNLTSPVLYVHHPLNRDARLLEAVFAAGGLGFIDHAVAGPAEFTVPTGVKYGMRIRWESLTDVRPDDNCVAVMIALDEHAGVRSGEDDVLQSVPVPVIMEVADAEEAREAERLGAAALIARGAEGPGWVGETTGLVLLQQIREASALPVFLQGGVGIHTAAGAVAAGAAGVVLDVHLLLTTESSVSDEIKTFLRGLGLPATTTLLEGHTRQCRVYARIGTASVRALRKEEECLNPEACRDFRETVREALTRIPEQPDRDEGLIALSEDIITARELADSYGSARDAVRAFVDRMQRPAGQWPFAENSPLARAHDTRFPIVQGPMAHVSDNPDFLAAVAAAGALPMLAMGNMPRPIAEEGIKLAREKTGGKFGVGLIGLEVNRKNYEAHLEIMADNPPPFAVLAAGSVDLAGRIESMGTRCYLHCPAPAVVAEGLQAGRRNFVFEGGESGGHIGLLGSLDLWNANLRELESAAAAGLDLGEVSILLAGGIATPRAVAFCAAMVEDFTARGLRVGLQLGTAYLTADEAVNTCAITETYRKLIIESHSTVVIGRTVNIRARAAGSPMAAELIEKEQNRIKERLPLKERKHLYEVDNLGALRLASKGCAIDPDTATWDCPVFCDLEPDEQLKRGLYLMGQGAAVLNRPTTIEELHLDLLENGRLLFGNRVVAEPAQSEEPQREVVTPEVMPDVGPSAVFMDEEPIAVVGMGLILPGSDSPESFWDRILSGRSGIREVPDGRWGKNEYYYDPDPKAPDKTYTKIGGFIDDFQFDPLAYRIPPTIAGKMDRTQQMAVSCVGKALEDAGLSPKDLKGRRVGVIVGNSMGGPSTDLYATRVNLPHAVACLEAGLAGLDVDSEVCARITDNFRTQYLEDLPVITEDSLPGELPNVISGRIANVFNLEGPNFTVDAACASSMAALMNAVSGLRNGTMDLAISGGVDAAMHPSSFIKFCKIGALSPDGSRPFDEGANGFVMGEGAGMLVLKRLSDAVRDGDRVYGVIVEIGSSSDGRGKGITAPNAAGQERAVRACLEKAGVEPSTIGLIEAHGTSTAVGDKTELMVLDAYLREHGARTGTVGIGSVKSQIGHLKAAAGAAGVIKALLAMHHKTLPPTINVKTPNRCIDWDTSPLSLLTEPRPWPADNGLPRRAGVSAFGFGGTNFHVLLQEHVPGLRVIQGGKKRVEEVSFTPPSWPSPPEMNIDGEAVVIGAAHEDELIRKLEEAGARLTSEGFAAAAGDLRREALNAPLRCGFAARSADEAAEKLTFIAQAYEDPKKRAFLAAKGVYLNIGQSLSEPGPAFLFPGQGSQYPYMLRDLCERFPIVAETVREAETLLSSLGLPALTELIFPDPSKLVDEKSDGGDALKETQVLQPLILTANTAVFRLLERMGVRPSACAGHSLGEYAACVAAGVFTFADALEAVAVRGREMARVSIADPGMMMSIPADARVVEEVLNQVKGYVVAANKNSPKQTVISGETQAVKDAAKIFKERGLDPIPIPVSAAFHSGVVAPAREPFMKTLKKLQVNAPTVPILSNVTGDFYPVGPAAADKIRDLLGKQFAAPVEWVKTLRRLHSDGIRLFLECGPKRVMTNLTLDTLPDDVLALPTNHPKKGGIMQLMETLAALVVHGIPVDFDAAVRPTSTQPVPEQPALRVMPAGESPTQTSHAAPESAAPHPLEALMDDELRKIASQTEFARYLELQAKPVRDLIKSGYENFVETILPMDKTVRQVQSEGMDFQPVVVSGIAAGLPSDIRFPFDRENLDDLVLGRNFIKQVPEEGRKRMLSKNIERLVKGPGGEVELRPVENDGGVIKLAGYFENDTEIAREYGIEEKLADAMDVTTRLAIAAGLEALRDAGIPLVRQNRTTTTGRSLPEAWALPEPLRAETGVIFASAFPGLASLVDEVTREAAARFGSGARKRLIDFYSGIVGRVQSDAEREAITRWFTEEFAQLNPDKSEELYSFNRNFLLRVTVMAHGQMAQYIKAQGPNTHIDAACAGTTQAVLMARDWIRSGQAKRVVVIAADDAAGSTLLPWVGSGFLAVGAATTEGKVGDAALPFDDRRAGLIIGSAAAALVLEKQDLVEQRGMEALASVETGMTANSAFHGTRLDVDHICSVMEHVVRKWEEQSGLSRDELAKNGFFMSHETYSPKRGGSSEAEIRALRTTFGDKASMIPITNTKGFTGHTMGVGLEDVVALRCLQKGVVPPIPNLKTPDPAFAGMNLSKGGRFDAQYALRLAAGFGSQIVVALYKSLSKEENRITDLREHREWLKRITGYSEPVVSVEERTLRVVERPAIQEEPAASASSEHPEESVVVGAPKQSHSASADKDHVRETILTLLAEKTGYPADMLDTDLDLEADLGIDTVKQAEFISEIRDAFGIPRIEGLKIADFPTIEHIIGFVLEHTAGTVADDMTGSPTASASSAVDESAIREQVLGLLADKTGYPADMLDTELDLEADLGIDTVKQAEFITEVREAFGIPRIEGLKIADFPTIDHIIRFVIERGAPSTEASESADEMPAAEQLQTQPGPDIRLYEARLVPMPESTDMQPPTVDEVLIVGGDRHLTTAIESSLAEIGYDKIVTVDAIPEPEALKGKRIGIVNLLAWNSQSADRSAMSDTFRLSINLAEAFESGPVFLITVVSEDGGFGFERPSPNGSVYGGIAGATKAFGREFPDCVVRMFDVHPDVAPDAVAQTVALGLKTTVPMETGVASDGSMRVVRMVPTVEHAGDRALSGGEVVLATGGARGITAACLECMAREHNLTFAILGRTELSARAGKLARYDEEDWNQEKQRIIERFKRGGQAPTPVAVEKELSALRSEAEVHRTIESLKALGSEVIYRSVDIRDRDKVHAAVRDVAELCGRIDIVVHAAGIDISKAMRGKTPEQAETVFSVKIDGMENVLYALEREDLPPGRIIGFGSVSGRFGNMAQLDYAAANDALAHMLRRVDRDTDARASIIDWAPWSDIGMAVRGSVQQTLEEAGIDFIPPARGAELFMQELARTDGAGEVLAAGRVGPFASDAFLSASESVPTDVMLAGQKATVAEFIPGEHVKVVVSVDPNHPLLHDHRIDKAAILPGVGGLEMMRSATALLDPRCVAASFQSVKFLSPIKLFKDEPFELEVDVVRRTDSTPENERYEARITSWFRDRSGNKVGSVRVHHECELTPRPITEIAVDRLETWDESLWIPEEDIYDVFFHGPAFRFIDRLVFDTQGSGVRFEFMDTPERPSMFTDAIPAALEAVFQAGAGFGVETREVTALPVGVDEIAVTDVRSKPIRGELRLVEETEFGDDKRRSFRFDGLVFGEDGREIMYFRGARMSELGISEPFTRRVFECVLNLSEVEDALNNDETGFIKGRLSADEAQEYGNKKVPKRAHEWLAGRIALKRSVQALCKHRGAPIPAEDTIRIVADENGKPIAELTSAPGTIEADVSLSHSNGTVVAAATEPRAYDGLGIDVEHIEERSESWAGDYFTEHERGVAGNGASRWAMLTGLWALKEATLKALGTGLAFDLKDIEVRAVDERGLAEVALHGEAEAYLRSNSGGAIEARVTRDNGFATARVVIRQSGDLAENRRATDKDELRSA